MTFRSMALAGVAACAMVFTAPAARADLIQLGFILDASGSIGASNWTTITSGLATAVGNIAVPVNAGDDTYEVSVVRFATNASAVISNVQIDSVAARNALVASIAGIAYTGGNTNFAAAFTAMQGVLGNTIANADATYVNFATDGQQNVGGTGIPEFTSMWNSGVDNVSVEGIGSGVDKNDLMANFCGPTPCIDTGGNLGAANFPAQGFYIGVADAAGYAAAIDKKVRLVTNNIPEPASLALFGAGLLGLAVLRRRAA